ncbi:MAG TPA: isoleucine--tRNA ligase [Candidatus Acidoferrales bacterium]|nr:isoleucine--tRNA ligase [Candidatus Acidoferrales bacterium]
MAKPLDLKSTINLPRTDFPMKAQLPQREPQQLAQWEAEKLYQRILESRAQAQLFVLHDGPPYPTGDIHLGTGLNKIMKDMVVKSKTMAGFRSPYIPGWDCHGLPIESKVEKQLGGKKDSVAPAEFRRMCREFAVKYIDQNRRDFKRLGVLGRWEKPYLTMDPEHEATIADAFLTFMEKGYVYKGLKPVYWCISDRTALAEAEVEYADHTSPSIYVRFKLAQDGADTHNIPVALKGKNVYGIIWTTTPWTIPASMALAFHPDFVYAAVETDSGDVYLVADQLRKSVADACGYKESKLLATYKGSELEAAHLKFHHPFLDRLEPAVLADYVTLEQGTGIVHTAPGHGADDFRTGQKYGIGTYAPLDDDGRFVEGLPEYKGKTVFEANPLIIKLLESRGALIGQGKLRHSYPHCWRCHNPVIFRATEQWFIDLEHDHLRRHALDEIRKVKWTPEWGEQRLSGMVAERPDWCISRQRFWGVPLIVMYCEQCGEQFKDFHALRNVIRWFEREGADAWFTHSAEELLPPGTKCKCGSSRFRKEKDILDVWFESGSTSLAVLKDGMWPADVYLEGPDQYRGWFQSSLLVGIGTRDRAPYKQVVTHGWTLDAEGRPMSKSAGNGVLPSEICEKWGADLLRLWTTSQDYHADVRFSEPMMTQLAESYRKIRNTFRFALGNLANFDPARDAVADSELSEMDAWMLHRTGERVAKCRAWYDEFEFHRVFHALYDFFVVDLSAFYFDVLKDSLYTFAPRNIRRRSAQTAIYRITSALVRLAAPILVFTSEEVWKHLPRAAGEPDSVHMALFPKAEDFTTGLDRRKLENWESLLAVREQALKKLEEARNAKLINSALEAKLLVRASGKTLELLKNYASSLPQLFIVSQVSVEPSHSNAAPASGQVDDIEVVHADGRKCERCWNYSIHVGENADYPTICERCTAAIAEIESSRDAAVESANR